MNFRLALQQKIVVVVALLASASMSAYASPVAYSITLSATSGSQFGVTAPSTFTGTFSVDSAFLAQANGSYGGTAITNFFLVIGTQTFNQNTAFSPNIQGITLLNGKIVGLGMNWAQTNSGLAGPYMQMGNAGAWEAGSTANQPGANILRGGDGTQSFLRVRVLDVDGNGSVDPLTDGLMLIRYMLGLRGTALTTGAVGAGATRDAAQIEAYIESKM
ncbi:MAG: hypothetical protein ABIZ64_00070 [Casimicrobium sp.]|jgi:hypothetical protein